MIRSKICCRAQGAKICPKSAGRRKICSQVPSVVSVKHSEIAMISSAQSIQPSKILSRPCTSSRTQDFAASPHFYPASPTNERSAERFYEKIRDLLSLCMPQEGKFVRNLLLRLKICTSKFARKKTKSLEGPIDEFLDVLLLVQLH